MKYRGALLCMAMLISPLSQAAYPKKMAVTVEIWNDTGTQLNFTTASWLAAGTDLSASVIPQNAQTAHFGLTLNNPMNDSAIFRLRSGARECKFTLGHEKVFSWFGLSPAPDKFATAKSTGTIPTRCSASVIKGLKSMEAYSVRVRMS
jgi:hypothetical protein